MRTVRRRRASARLSAGVAVPFALIDVVEHGRGGTEGRERLGVRPVAERFDAVDLGFGDIAEAVVVEIGQRIGDALEAAGLSE